MSGLSLMQTRNLIDRLGDLDDEITRVCKIGTTVAKGAPKGHADEISRLKTAMTAAEDCQKHLLMAKKALLEFDGFLHAQRPSLREALMHPDRGGKAAGFLDQVGRKAGPAMEHHAGSLGEEAVECVGRVRAAIKAVQEAEETDARKDDAKLSCKALEKTISAAEKAIEKAVKFASAPEHGYEHMHASDGDEAEVEEEVEVEVREATTHGYNLTAVSKSKCKALMEQVVEESAEDEGDEGIEASKKAGDLPDFIKEKQEEREGDKDDDKDDDEKESCRKSAHGYDLTADSKVPGDESEGPEEEGEEDQGYDPGRTTDEEGEPTPIVEKGASGHGYHITAPTEHGYELTA